MLLNMPLSRLVLIVSAGCLLTTLILGFMAFPSIFRVMVERQISLREGSQLRQYYLKIPIPLEFRVYFFNVSNPEAIQEGHTPILQEVGPYCFDTYKSKINITDDDEEDSLTYTPYETFFYNATCSGHHSPDDYVTILNPLVVGMVNAVLRISPVLLPTVVNAFKSLFDDPQSIYLTVKVRDILFDGIPINCTGSDFAAKAVCSQIKAESAALGLKEAEKNVFMFSLLGMKNGTITDKRFKVLRGTKNSKDLGRLLEVDGKKQLKMWSTEDCNTFHGTDGWVFPPFLSKEEGMWSYAQDICRNIHLEYKEDVEYEGIAVRKHEGTLGDMSSKEEDRCYCSSPTKCSPKGVFDLHKCVKVPLIATLPHFYQTDEMFLSQVHGLKPDKEKHALEAIVEPTLGMPVMAYERLQLNLMIDSLEQVPFMTKLPKALHPILWLEQGVVIKGTLLEEITSVFSTMKTITIIKYLVLFGSLVGLVLGGYFVYRDRNTSSKVSISSGPRTGNFDLDNKMSNGQEFVNKTSSNDGSKKF